MATMSDETKPSLSEWREKVHASASYALPGVSEALTALLNIAEAARAYVHSDDGEEPDGTHFAALASAITKVRP